MVSFCPAMRAFIWYVIVTFTWLALLSSTHRYYWKSTNIQAPLCSVSVLQIKWTGWELGLCSLRSSVKRPIDLLCFQVKCQSGDFSILIKILPFFPPKAAGGYMLGWSYYICAHPSLTHLPDVRRSGLFL